MTKIDIVSGFLGAGKTTLIKKLIEEAFKGEKLVLIENEFGEIGIDGGFLKDAGIEITEMNSGCICCSLVGDFGTALKEVIDKFAPDRIIIEPSGVGKLSDVVKAVNGIEGDITINSTTAVVDGMKTKMYMKNFGEFFNNQVENAGTIVISRTQKMPELALDECIKLLKEHNNEATIITTDWASITGKQILEAMEKKNTLSQELMMEEDICPECGCHHDHEHHHHEDGECHHDHEHHHHEDGECCHHDHEHHHHEDGECHRDHEHHHHEDGECHRDHEHHHHEDGECHRDHEHHHDHDGECCCGHHHDHDHEHHHADEVFTSWGITTAHKFNRADVEEALKKLSETEEYGIILRAKGIIPDTDDTWIYFDMVPGEYELRTGEADYTGKLCVIGKDLEEDKLAELFGV